MGKHFKCKRCKAILGVVDRRGMLDTSSGKIFSGQVKCRYCGATRKYYARRNRRRKSA